MGDLTYQLTFVYRSLYNWVFIQPKESQMKLESNRRQFLKLGSLTAFAAVVGARVATFGREAWAEALAAVDMSKKKRKDPANDAAVALLTGMGYVDDANAAEKAGKIKRTDKGNIPAAKQHCNVCILMEDQYVNGTAPGKCKVVQGVLVQAMGYCNTFGPSPKAKV